MGTRVVLQEIFSNGYEKDLIKVLVLIWAKSSKGSSATKCKLIILTKNLMVTWNSTK